MEYKITNMAIVQNFEELPANISLTKSVVVYKICYK
jgi:hypothetical protein